MSELTDQFNAFLRQAQQYFKQLNDVEKYAWLAQVVGLGIVIAGIILLF